MAGNGASDPPADRAVFEHLYKDGHDRLLSSITGMVRDRNRAEDITAAAFETAWEKRAQFRGEASLDTWLHAIGANAARNSWRKDRAAFRDSIDRLETRRYAQPDDLSAGLEQEELRGLVWKALNGIPAKCRRLLVDRYIDGHSIQEIARRERVPIGTVGSRLFLATRLFREAWDATTRLSVGGYMREEKVRQMAEEALDRLAAALAAGHSETLKEYLAAQARFHHYSWHNVMLIAAQRPSATRVAGYHAWHELGRFVKKGEKGITIYAPVLVKNREPSLVGGETKPKDVLRLSGFRTAHVFDVEQTEGKPLPPFAETKGEPKEYADRLKAIVAKQNIALEYDPSIAPAQGVSSGGHIRIVPGLSAAEEFAALAHELAHEMLHHGNDNTRVPKTVRETQAEAVAFVVCRSVGLETNTAAADYIALYNGDKKTLAESLSAIHDASTRILNELLPEERVPPTPERISEPMAQEHSHPSTTSDRLESDDRPSAERIPDRTDSVSLDR